MQFDRSPSTTDETDLRLFSMYNDESCAGAARQNIRRHRGQDNFISSCPEPVQTSISVHTECASTERAYDDRTHTDHNWSIMQHTAL